MSKIHLSKIIILIELLTIPAFARSGWELVNSTDDHIRLYTRQRANKAILEVRGISQFSVPPNMLRMALYQVEYFVGNVPYLTKVELIKKEGRERWIYQRLAPPVVDDRDYTLHMIDLSPPTPENESPPYYLHVWTLSKDVGPAPQPGVVRTPINEGFWLILPINGGKESLAINNFVADPGGLLPDFVINMANTKALPNLLRGFRKLAKDPRYDKRLPYLDTPLPRIPKHLERYVKEAESLVHSYLKKNNDKR